MNTKCLNDSEGLLSRSYVRQRQLSFGDGRRSRRIRLAAESKSSSTEQILSRYNMTLALRGERRRRTQSPTTTPRPTSTPPLPRKIPMTSQPQPTNAAVPLATSCHPPTKAPPKLPVPPTRIKPAAVLTKEAPPPKAPKPLPSGTSRRHDENVVFLEEFDNASLQETNASSVVSDFDIAEELRDAAFDFTYFFQCLSDTLKADINDAVSPYYCGNETPPPGTIETAPQPKGRCL